jgi:hypothetical protein
MSSSIKTVRGVEKVAEKRCSLCGEIVFYPFKNGIRAGMCECPESDHYGHIVSEMHPACSKLYEDKKQNPPDVQEDDGRGAETP